MVENQSEMFANSTIAATTSNLYTESYGEIIEYVTNVLNDTGNILFVVISKNGGEDIVITKNNWIQSKDIFNGEKLKLSDNKSVLHFESTVITKGNSFVLHKKFDIGGAPWGMITIGMSDSQYQDIKNKYMLIVGAVSAILVAILLLLFHRSAKKIRAQMANLSETGFQLQMGNLSARASENGIGEIGSLSKAINTMATNLLEQTNSSKQLAQIVKQTNDAFILFDTSLNIIFVNDAVADVTGYATSHFENFTLARFTNLLNLDLNEILHELDWVSAHTQHSPTRDVVILKSNQLVIDVEIRIESITHDKNPGQGQEQNFLMVLSNITTRKHLEKELHQLAFYDKLTDLPNRRMFMDYMRNAIEYSKKNNKSFALFFMDLDNFKFINDTLGHDAGDEFLVQIGNRLKEIVRESDMVTRLGGDEFTILIEDVKSSGVMDVVKLAEKLVKELASKPIYISGRPLSISTSLGIAQYPEHGNDCDTLLRNADIAMYSAKKSGKNRYALFSEEMNARLRHLIEIEADLKQAIASGTDINFHYQPIIDLTNNQLVGVEALARWNHPIKGFISPDEFIPIAEGSNLIVELSDYLLKIAFKQAQAWSQLAFVPYMSINISGKQFEKNSFIHKLVNALDTYKIKASNIQLEFTESIMLDSTKETILKFEELKKMGFKIAIDDFGTGYSSLAYIHKLPIDVIKIDKTFVKGMIKNKKTHSIVAAITKLSNVLDIKTIAEGIELAEQVQILKQLQCDYGQGFWYAQALPIEEFREKYLRNFECN